MNKCAPAAAAAFTVKVTAVVDVVASVKVVASGQWQRLICGSAIKLVARTKSIGKRVE